jgi:type II secretory ATPase GspE/PulE/Tfp pilus assembly ATPase PilB-like protein
MLRRLIVLAGAMVICAIDAQILAAAEVDSDWPSLGAPFFRGSGDYLSLWKIMGYWLLFLAWVRTTDWISQDAQVLKLRYTLWNHIAFFTFLVALLILWVLPWFAVGMALVGIAYVAPLACYIVYRNRNVLSSYDKVLSRQHTRRWLAKKVSAIGIKMEGADIDPRDLGPDIQFKATGAATDRENSINQVTARQSPGFLPARELVDDAKSQRATDIMLDYTAESVGTRYLIDGVWHDRAPLDRASGDMILTVFKALAVLKVEDRRSRQSGSFGVEAAKEKFTCKIMSQGTQTGERVLLQLEQSKVPFKTLEELGMRPKTQEQIEALFQQNGMIIFSSMPGGGLTTTLDLVLSQTDRFIRNFVAVVEEKKTERDIENIHVTTFSSAEGETPATVLPKLIRTYPDVIIVRDLADLETLSILCEQVGERRLVVTAIRAKEAAEALLRVMMLKIPPADFAAAVAASINVRLIRKLCEKCKEGYPPPAEVLKQLGLPAGRIEALYRPPTAPIDPKHPDVVCDQCQGVGYFGRTAIFEVLMVDDTIRQVLTTAPKLENLRAAVRKAKQRTLQEEGVLLVARGVTSIQELLRVLKQQ